MGILSLDERSEINSQSWSPGSDLHFKCLLENNIYFNSIMDT